MAGLPELDLPGYDALVPDGANINLAIGVDAADPVSGAASHRCYPVRHQQVLRLTYSRQADGPRRGQAFRPS